MNLDKQNRNPSRLSRCPDGRRTVDGDVRRQRLLALQFGAESWTAWETKQATPDEGALMPISQLAVYDTSHDPNNILGKRWLCRGGSLVVVGQSGIGKSSLCMQLMILWALGLPAFNITPVAPLRSLLIQAENDVGDLAEMYQGVRQGRGITPEQEAILNERIFIYRDTTRTGPDFVNAAAALSSTKKNVFFYPLKKCDTCKIETFDRQNRYFVRFVQGRRCRGHLQHSKTYFVLY